MKTNQKIVLIILSLLLGISLNAQDKKITPGVKAGMNLSNFSGDMNNTDAKVGFNVGVTVDYAFTNDLFLLTGLELTTKGTKVSFEGEKLTFNPMYLQVPIHLGYKLNVAENTKLVFRAGPYLAYGVGGKATGEADGEKEKIGVFKTGLMKNFDFGLGLGVGAEFGKIGVNLGYDFGVVNVYDMDSWGVDGSVRNGNFSVGLGYKF